MKSDAKTTITIVACSIFRLELDAIAAAEAEFPAIIYLDSMLHMYPQKLRALLDPIILAERRKGHRVCVVYGECHPWMDGAGRDLNVQRVRGMNCIELFLGRERYCQLRSEGAFFLLPEWVERWWEVFQHELGLNPESAKSLMGEMHSSLIYLDSGLQKVPTGTLDQLSAYTGLPWSRIACDTRFLSQAVHQTLDLLESLG